MVASIGNKAISNSPISEVSSRPLNNEREGRAISTNSGQTSIRGLGNRLYIYWMLGAVSAVSLSQRISRAEAKPLNDTPSGHDLSNFLNGLGHPNATAYTNVPAYRKNASTAERLTRRQEGPAVPNCPAPVVPSGTPVPTPTPLTGPSGIPVLGPNNLPVVLHPYHKYPVEQNPDGTLAKDANGNVPILDCEGKPTNTVIPPGKPGDPVLSEKGLPLNTPEGFPVVYYDNLNVVAVNNGTIVADKLGNPYLVANDGNWMKTPDEHYVVLDRSNHDKPVAADIDGNTIGDNKGNPYALTLGQDGKYTYLHTAVNNLVAYDKSNNHNPIATDRYGNGIMDQRGNLYALHEDGQYQKSSDGCRYFVYDKHNGNTVAPALRHSADVIDYINTNHGTERIDPDKLKNELAGDSGFLDSETLWNVVLKYDPLDVYDALMLSSNNRDKAENELAKGPGTKITPTLEIALSTAASFIQLSAVAGKSANMEIGKLPKITFYELENIEEVGGIARNQSIGMELPPNPDQVRIAAVLIHELNHALAGFGPKYLSSMEALTEFLATLQTGITKDNPYEKGLEDIPHMKYEHYWNTALLAMLSDPSRATGKKEDMVVNESDFPRPLADGSYPAIEPGQYAEGIKTLCQAYYDGAADAQALFEDALSSLVERSIKIEYTDVPKLTGNEAPACIPLKPVPPKTQSSSNSQGSQGSLSPAVIAAIALAGTGLVLGAGGLAYHLMKKRADAAGDNVV